MMALAEESACDLEGLVRGGITVTDNDGEPDSETTEAIGDPEQGVCDNSFSTV